MRLLVYQVAIGEQRPLWQHCLDSVGIWCKRHGYDHHIQREPLLRIRPKNSQRSANALRLGYLPNLEKLAGLDHLPSYDGVIIMDADVWLRPNAPSIVPDLPPTCDVAGCPERAMPIVPAYAKKLDWYERGQFGPVQWVGLPFIQFGVVVYLRSFLRFVPDGARALLARPDLQPFIDGQGSWKWQTEQTTMNWFLRSQRVHVHHFPHLWNGLYGVLNPGEIERCHAIHFFLSAHIHGSEDPETLLRINGRPKI